MDAIFENVAWTEIATGQPWLPLNWVSVVYTLSVSTCYNTIFDNFPIMYSVSQN